jgi:glutaredoxin
MPSPRNVVLYARPDCHLCDEARAGLERLRADGLDFELVEIDIDRNDELHARFLERIPVVEVDGTIVSELVLDANAVTAHLRS